MRFASSPNQTARPLGGLLNFFFSALRTVTAEIDYFRDIPTLLRALRTVEARHPHIHLHRHEQVPHTHLQETSLFRSNTYSICYLSAGEAVYTIGLSEYHMRAGDLYFQGPQHLRYYKKLSPWKGFVLLFTEDFLRGLGLEAAHCSRPYFALDADVRLPLGNEQATPFLALLETLLLEQDGPPRHRQAILGHYLAVLLLKIRDAYDARHAPDRAMPGRAVPVVKAFEHLLEEHFFRLVTGQDEQALTVADFAERLHLHPHHLSDTVKKALGKTPKRLLRERLALEAKALLNSTALSVSEVGYRLGFADPSYFAKFFKATVGSSPSDFRAA